MSDCDWDKMADNQRARYKSGDVVWVKFGLWWPGKVTENDPGVFTFKKPPLAIVKFFNETTYKFVKSYDEIYAYNCERKNEFIMDGINTFRTNKSYMEKFSTDVCLAESHTNGNPNILSDPMFAPKKKRKCVAEVSGNSSKRKGRKRKRKRASTSARTARKPAKKRITNRRLLGCDDYEAHVRLQYPGKDREHLGNDVESPLDLNTEPNKIFNCSQCPFYTKRVEVLMSHVQWCHIEHIPSQAQVEQKTLPKKPEPVISEDDRTKSNARSLDTDREEEVKLTLKRKKTEISTNEEKEEKKLTLKRIKNRLISDSSENDDVEVLKKDTSRESVENRTQTIEDEDKAREKEVESNEQSIEDEDKARENEVENNQQSIEDEDKAREKEVESNEQTIEDEDKDREKEVENNEQSIEDEDEAREKEVESNEQSTEDEDKAIENKVENNEQSIEDLKLYFDFYDDGEENSNIVQAIDLTVEHTQQCAPDSINVQTQLRNRNEQLFFDQKHPLAYKDQISNADCANKVFPHLYSFQVFISSVLQSLKDKQKLEFIDFEQRLNELSKETSLKLTEKLVRDLLTVKVEQFNISEIMEVLKLRFAEKEFNLANIEICMLLYSMIKDHESLCSTPVLKKFFNSVRTLDQKIQQRVPKMSFPQMQRLSIQVDDYLSIIEWFDVHLNQEQNQEQNADISPQRHLPLEEIYENDAQYWNDLIIIPLPEQNRQTEDVTCARISVPDLEIIPLIEQRRAEDIEIAPSAERYRQENVSRAVEVRKLDAVAMFQKLKSRSNKKTEQKKELNHDIIIDLTGSDDDAEN